MDQVQSSTGFTSHMESEAMVNPHITLRGALQHSVPKGLQEKWLQAVCRFIGLLEGPRVP